MSEEDTFAEDPIIVFGEDENDNDAPIAFGVRQPSFSQLQGTRVTPKGFDSIADFRAEKPIVKATPFVDADGNTRSLSINELLTKRNRMKWEQMGYDPESMAQSLEKNRNCTMSSFAVPSSSALSKKNEPQAFSSFSNIDSFSMINKNVVSQKQALAPIIGIVEEEPIIEEKTLAQPVTEKKPRRGMTRSRSSDKSSDLILVMPNTETRKCDDTFCTELSSPAHHGGSTESLNTYQQNRGQQQSIPEGLIPYVTHDPDTWTYHALCGEPMTGADSDEITCVITDLKKYVDIAVEHDLIGEGIYIQGLIENMKSEKVMLRYSQDKTTEIDDKMQEAQDLLNEKIAAWEHEEQRVNDERAAAMEDLDRRYEAAAAELDDEWKSERKQQIYMKPSAALLNMRCMMQKMIKAKKLTDIEALGKQIEEKEREESATAAAKMQADYQAADAKLEEVYKTERLTIEGKHEKRINNIARLREVELRPLHQRLENLKRSKETLVANQKQVMSEGASRAPTAAGKTRTRAGTRSSARSNAPNVQASHIPAFVQNPKLSVPTIMLKKRTKPSASSTLKR